MPNVKKEKEIEYAMTNNFAFGGNNASVIFAKHERPVKEIENNKVYITGLGLVSPLGNSVESYIEGTKAGRTTAENGSIHANVSSEDYAEYGIKLAFYR